MDTKLLDLPQECLSLILSFTSPLYVLRCSLVCKIFNSVANSDLTWKNLVPSDLHPLIQGPSSTSSTKNLVLLLCRSFIMLEDGVMCFSLDKWTGTKTYVMGARKLTLAHSNTIGCWGWKQPPLNNSRFLEVAELLGVTELHITGRISTKLLSSNTTYRVYFSFTLEDVSCGFDNHPVRVFVSKINTNGAYLGHRHDTTTTSKTFYLKAPVKGEMFDNDANGGEDSYKHNGSTPSWMKIDMGKYYNKGDGDGVAMLEMTLMGTEIGLRKKGLVVHAIELLPVD